MLPFMAAKLDVVDPPARWRDIFLRFRAVVYDNHYHVPSEKLLMASLEGDSARYLSVTWGSPSLIMR